MKRLVLIISTIFMICNSCCTDGLPSIPEFKFRIIDENRNNLTNQGIYSMDSITVYGYFDDGFIDKRELITYSNYYLLALSGNTPNYVIRYINGDKDSITFDFLRIQDECGEYISNFSVKINGIDICSSCSNDTIEIIKFLK